MLSVKDCIRYIFYVVIHWQFRLSDNLWNILSVVCILLNNKKNRGFKCSTLKNYTIKIFAAFHCWHIFKTFFTCTLVDTHCMVCRRGRRRRLQARGYTRGSSLAEFESGLEARGDAGPSIIGRERRLLGLATVTLLRVTLRAKFTDTARLSHTE